MVHGIWVFCGGMSDAMDEKTGVKLFRLRFSTITQEKKYFTGPPSRKTQSKKVESRKTLSTRSKKARCSGLQSKTAVFD